MRWPCRCCPECQVGLREWFVSKYTFPLWYLRPVRGQLKHTDTKKRKINTFVFFYALLLHITKKNPAISEQKIHDSINWRQNWIDTGWIKPLYTALFNFVYFNCICGMGEFNMKTIRGPGMFHCGKKAGEVNFHLSQSRRSGCFEGLGDRSVWQQVKQVGLSCLREDGWGPPTWHLLNLYKLFPRSDAIIIWGVCPEDREPLRSIMVALLIHYITRSLRGVGPGEGGSLCPDS